MNVKIKNGKAEITLLQTEKRALRRAAAVIEQFRLVPSLMSEAAIGQIHDNLSDLIATYAPDTKDTKQ